MFRSYTLQPAVWHQQPLEFEWDSASGSVRGRDADRVREMASSAITAGHIVGHPYPTSYPITDPLRNLSDMAALLGNDWQLSDDLADAYPHIDDDDDIPVMVDKSGTEIQIQMLN